MWYNSDHMDQEQIYRVFVNWKARPITPNGPEPKTVQEFCQRYNITIKDLISFSERPEYKEDLVAASIDWAKSKTPELLQIVYQEVKLNKSVADLERFLNIIHEIKRKDNAKTFNQFNFIVDDKQYREIVAREAKLLESGSKE